MRYLSHYIVAGSERTLRIRHFGDRARDTIGADSLTVLIPSALPSAVGAAHGPVDADVDKVRRTNVFDAAIVTASWAEIVKEPFAAPQQDRHYRQMHFIDERSTQVLPDGGCATSDKDIAVTGRLKGRTECGFSPAIDEMKGCSPLHFDRARGS